MAASHRPEGPSADEHLQPETATPVPPPLATDRESVTEVRSQGSTEAGEVTSAEILAVLGAQPWDASSWPPMGDTQMQAGQFGDVDLGPLARLVREHGWTAAQLRELADGLERGDPLRATALLGMVWSEEVTDEERGFLLEQVVRPEEHRDPNARDTFAAVYALTLLEDDQACQRAATRLLDSDDRYLETNVYAGLLALRGVRSNSDPEFTAKLEQLVAPENASIISSHFWRALCSLEDGAGAIRALIEGEAGAGHARSGLEGLRDDRLLPDLAVLIERHGDSVYAGHLARSAVTGLLSIGSEASLETLRETLFRWPGLNRAYRYAFQQPGNPSAIGALLRLSVEHDERFDPYQSAGQLIHEHARACLRELELHHLSPRLHDRVLVSLHEVLPSLPDRSVQLQLALGALYREAGGEDRERLRAHLRRLTPEQREALR